MIEVKEIHNTLSGQDFISKDYQRKMAIGYINVLSESLACEVKNGMIIAEDTFHSLSGAVYAYRTLDILTSDEAELFMNAVIHNKNNCIGFATTMHVTGTITSKYIRK